jgi:hypothetical protein
MAPIFEQHQTIHNGIVDGLGQFAHTLDPRRKIMHRVSRQRFDSASFSLHMSSCMVSWMTLRRTHRLSTDVLAPLSRDVTGLSRWRVSCAAMQRREWRLLHCRRTRGRHEAWRHLPTGEQRGQRLLLRSRQRGYNPGVYRPCLLAPTIA